MGIMNELKTRGVQDILIAAVNGLIGFPDAITTIFPKTTRQSWSVQENLSCSFSRIG
jgi:transposase-like protein